MSGLVAPFLENRRSLKVGAPALILCLLLAVAAAVALRVGSHPPQAAIEQAPKPTAPAPGPAPAAPAPTRPGAPAPDVSVHAAPPAAKAPLSPRRAISSSTMAAAKHRPKRRHFQVEHAEAVQDNLLEDAAAAGMTSRSKQTEDRQ